MFFLHVRAWGMHTFRAGDGGVGQQMRRAVMRSRMYVCAHTYDQRLRAYGRGISRITQALPIGALSTEKAARITPF